MSEPDIVLCLPWGSHLVPSVRVSCRGCGRALAMSKVVRRELPKALAECRRCAVRSGGDMPILLTDGARAEAEAFGVSTDEPMPTVAEWARRMRPW